MIAAFLQASHTVKPARFLPRALHASAAAAMASAVKCTKEWHAPSEGQPAHLVLLNSLTDDKVPFIPTGGQHSKQITWYTCGPTVYDVAHMGHARNYLSFDIVRRVLEDYFGYNIMFVMNVTDVDDKIIIRARRNHLLARYCAEGHTCQEVMEFARAAVQQSEAKQRTKQQEAAASAQAASSEAAQAGHKGSMERRRKELEGAEKGEAHKLAHVQGAAASLAALKLAGDTAGDINAILGLAGDFVAEALDASLGSGVTDQSIFRAHAAKYEREFFEDLDALGCRRPDVLTRVSEFVPEIVQYVEQIITNDLAYASNGSVYFDTQKFRTCGHTYGKLKPWAVGSCALASESESNFETTEKRSPTDFALWKAFKAGEPFWDSPWGKGRPGWHIECSAMACAVAGSKLDIHTGGDDLKFPHHDNELAQAEAYYHTPGCTDACKQWVNYFLHSGHLSIEGLKMSKSLKNFITVRDALKSYSSRQLRLLFALQSWNKPMVYGESSRQEMHAKEMLLRNFFQNVDVILRSVEFVSHSAKWGAEERELNACINAAQMAVHTHLLDNIDTGKALEALCEMIRHINVYLANKQDPAVVAAGGLPQPLLLRKAAAYVTRILSVFGIVEGSSDRPGLADTSTSSATASVGSSYLDAFAAFRDEVRSLARAKAEPGKLMAACDRVRDTTLVDLGVRLEDKPDGNAVWKLDDPAALRSEMAERASAAAAAQRKKIANALELRMKEHDKFKRLAELPAPKDAKAIKDKYSQFDATSGDPTHDKNGAALDDKARNKAKKDMDKLRKELEPLEKKLVENPGFLVDLGASIEQLRAQLAALDASDSGAEARNGTMDEVVK